MWLLYFYWLFLVSFWIFQELSRELKMARVEADRLLQVMSNNRTKLLLICSVLCYRSNDIHSCSLSSFPTSSFVPVARTCNLILIVLDVLKPLGHKKLIEHELEGFGIRLNKQPPNIGFKKKDKGGINFTATVGLTLCY